LIDFVYSGRSLCTFACLHWVICGSAMSVVVAILGRVIHLSISWTSGLACHGLKLSRRVSGSNESRKLCRLNYSSKESKMIVQTDNEKGTRAGFANR
jgi:hypothetical protein